MCKLLKYWIFFYFEFSCVIFSSTRSNFLCYSLQICILTSRFDYSVWKSNKWEGVQFKSLPIVLFLFEPDILQSEENMFLDAWVNCKLFVKYRDETERKKRRLEDKKMIGERRNRLVNGQEKRKRDYIMDKQKRDTNRKKRDRMSWNIARWKEIKRYSFWCKKKFKIYAY